MAHIALGSTSKPNDAFLSLFALETTHEIYHLLTAIELVRFSLTSRACLQSVQHYNTRMFQLFHSVGRFFGFDRELYREFRDMQLKTDFLIVGSVIRSFVLRRRPHGTLMDLICRTRHLYTLITFLHRAGYTIEVEGLTYSRPRPRDCIDGTYLKFVRRDDGDQDWYIYIWPTKLCPVALLLQSPTTADLNFASVSRVVVLYPYATLHLQHAVKNSSIRWKSDADDGLARDHMTSLEDEHFSLQQHPSWQSLMRRHTEFVATRLIGDRNCFTAPLDCDGMDEELLASSWGGLLSNSYSHRYRFAKGVGVEINVLRQCHWSSYYTFSTYATDGVTTCLGDSVTFNDELLEDDDHDLLEEDDLDLVAATSDHQREMFSREPMSRHPNAMHFVMGSRTFRVRQCRRKCQPTLHEYDLQEVSSTAVPTFTRDTDREDALMAFFKGLTDGLEQSTRPSPLIPHVINTGLGPVLKCLRFSPIIDVRLYQASDDPTTRMMTTRVTVWISSVRAAHSNCLPVTFEPYDSWDVPSDRFHYAIRFGVPETPMHPRAADISARYTGVDNLTPYHEVAQDLGNARDFVEDCVVRAYGEAATLQTLGMGDFSLIRRGRSLLVAYLFHFFDVFSCPPNLHFSFSRSYRAQNDGVFISGNIVTAMCVHVEVPCDWPSAGSWPFQVKLNPSMVEELKEYMISLLIMQDGVPWVSRIERGW